MKKLLQVPNIREGFEKVFIISNSDDMTQLLTDWKINIQDINQANSSNSSSTNSTDINSNNMNTILCDEKVIVKMLFKIMINQHHHHQLLLLLLLLLLPQN